MEGKEGRREREREREKKEEEEEELPVHMVMYECV